MTASKLVAIADLHAHPWAAFAKGDGLSNSRLQRSLKVLDASLATAAKLKAPWLFGGDLVHTAGYALNVVLAALTEVLGSYPGVLKLAVWGNHDARGVGGRITFEQTVWATLEHAVEGLYILKPNDLPINQYSGPNHGLTFSGAGAQPSGVDFTYARPSAVGLYHGTIAGSVGPNGFVFEHGLDPRMLLERHRLTIVGDIHHAQQIAAPPGKAILVPGSPEHHDFGDEGDHGFWVVTLPEDVRQDPEVEFIDGGSPKFLTVDTKAEVLGDGNFYRVRRWEGSQELPENAIAIGPTATTVAARDTLKGVAQREAILQAWLKECPPSVGTPVEYLPAGLDLLDAQTSSQLQDIRLQRLVVQNFCSYAEQTFEVRDGTWLVLGKGRDFPSNGAGKSSLFEAIFWMIFGRTTKGLTGDEVIRWGTGVCSVMGEFEYPDGTGLRVLRTRGERSQLIVEDSATGLWEAASVNEMTDKLTAHLGLTAELFQALGYFSQERMLLFASASDGERKDMLADLIGLGAYQSASAEAGGRHGKLELVATRAVALQEAAQKQAEVEWARLKEVNQANTDWFAAQVARLGKAEEALREFDAGRVGMRNLLLEEARTHLGQVAYARVTAAKLRVDDLRKALEQPKLQTSLETLDDLRRQYAEVTSKASGAKRGMDEAQRQFLSAQQRIKEQTEELASGVCPLCKQPITSDHRERCLAPAERELREASARYGQEQEELTRLVEEAAALKKRVDIATQGWMNRQQVQAWTDQLVVEEAEVSRAAQEMETVEAMAIEHVDGVLEVKRQELLDMVERIRAEKNPHEAREADIRRRITEASQTADGQEKVAEEARREQTIYDYWRHGFSKQGIQSLLVDEVAALFNRDRGLILPSLTQGVYDVQFSTRSQTKAGEWRERTEFQVYEHGVPVPYASLSGGQRRRIDVGVMLTLVKSVSSWMRVPGALGVLVLDEVFGFLDASGAEGLAETLREVQAQVPAVYVISHDPQLQALFADIIVVEQDADGISHIIEGAGTDVGQRERERQRARDDRRDREAHADDRQQAADGGATRGGRTVRRAPARAKRSGKRTRVDGDARGDGSTDVAHGDGRGGDTDRALAGREGSQDSE